MTKIKERMGTVRVVAEGEDLKQACCIWESIRTNNDDLWNAFKNSRFYNSELDFDEEVEMYSQFIDSLSGEDMFDIMRDGSYNWYE